MSQWRIVRLNFGTNSVHFGELGIGIEQTAERVRSDTLYSAVMSLYIRLYGQERLETLIDQLKKTPPFRLSSSFLYRSFLFQGKPQTIFYLPRPLLKPKGSPVSGDLAFSKEFKKLKFIPLDIWQRWYQGDGIAKDLDVIANPKMRKNKLQTVSLGALFSYKQAYHESVLPKVAIDRVTRASNFYQTGFIKFNHQPDNQSGLYFLIQLPDNSAEIESELYSVFTLLGEEGLGGERSSGAGQFVIEDWIDPAKPDDQKPWLKTWNSVLNDSQSNHYSLLSLYWPKELPLGLISPTTHYEVLERGGWAIGVAQRRKKVHMFAEGSVFPLQPEGDLADVTPPGFSAHSIYRSGISLSIPISVFEEES